MLCRSHILYYICIMTFDGLEFLQLSITDFFDILLVAVLIFMTIRILWGTSSMNIFLAIAFLFVVRMTADAFHMNLTSSLMKTVLDVGLVALIIIFQPEIRHFLMTLGGRSTITRSGVALLNRIMGRTEKQMGSAYVKEIVQACGAMSAEKTGALIVLPNKDPLTHIIETGDRVDAQISQRLIMNIFFKNSPLHDGAMIIADEWIVAARCTLPITVRTDIPAHYGMRHKAAIGISEESDASVIVVSEESGRISFVHGGEVETIENLIRLTQLLGEKDDKGKEQNGHD